MTNEELINLAIEARQRAYAPYSKWMVGAALLTKDGKVYQGCNIENSGYTATVCAERTAFFKAISEGVYDFEKIAIVGGNETEGITGICTPCGVCRQVMAEFCDPDSFRVISAKSSEEYIDRSLREMIPDSVYVATGKGYGVKKG